MLKVAVAAGRHFTAAIIEHRVVIGKDTRLSGYLLEPALTAGFISVGMDVVLTGPMPTPAVAMLTRTLRADLGVVISASHNPYVDNGIKFFGPDGYKLSDDIEAEIERNIDASGPLAPSDRLGRARRLDDAEGRYIEFVKATFPRGLRLDGLKIVIDLRQRCRLPTRPQDSMGTRRRGRADRCRSRRIQYQSSLRATHPEALQSQVVAHNADLGIALDGDADRLQNGRRDRTFDRWRSGHRLIVRSWHGSQASHRQLRRGDGNDQFRARATQLAGETLWLRARNAQSGR